MTAALKSVWESQGEARASLRYYDREFRRNAVKILPGEFYTTDEDVALITVLGSCVSACLRDPEARVGGMNHFMLPSSESDGAAGLSARYGSYAMELLVNDLLKRGAQRQRLQAKVFGGGHVLKHFSGNHVGARNAAFVRQYLSLERIAVLAEDLGECHARKLCFLPASGQAFVRRIDDTQSRLELASETAYGKVLSTRPIGGDVELFN